MKSSYRIGSIWGIPLKIHISLFLLLAYISLRAFVIGLQEYGLWHAIMIVLAVVSLQICLFASIGLHELGHSFVAIRKGCKVREITLLIIGGAAVMESIPRRPKDEFSMAIAGPAVSATLAILFGLLAYRYPPDAEDMRAWLGVLFYYTALGNGLLAIFNLLPAYPMDGGRITRALLTPRLGRLRATRIAMLTGRGFAIAIGAIGLMGLPPWIPRFYIPLLLIAGFVYIMGNREYRQIQLETLLEQRGFKTMPEYEQQGRFQEMPPDDETVLISPPPYRQGPSDHAHIEKEPHNRFSFFR